MRTVCIGVLLSTLFVTNLLAQEFLLTKYVDSNGRKLAFNIEQSKLRNYPEWNADSPIPLELHKAVEIAKSWANKRHENNFKFQASQILLQRLTEKNCWYFMVMLTAYTKTNDILVPSNEIVVVLLDGSVVEPKIEKEESVGSNNSSDGK